MIEDDFAISDNGDVKYIGDGKTRYTADELLEFFIPIWKKRAKEMGYIKGIK